MLQRTHEWAQARVGKVTASRISDVLAELKNKKEEPVVRRNYRREIVLEIYSGLPQEGGYQSFAMQQGIEKEAAARNTYAFAAGVSVEEVGFICHPTIEHAGCSPDGYIGDDGLLEIKAPEANAMWEMLTAHPLDKKYRDQVTWQMACTGRKWCDVVFYRDGLPLEIIRIERDDGAIAQMEQAVRQFLAEVDSEYQMLCKRYPK
jgi:hypothetical protein